MPADLVRIEGGDGMAVLFLNRPPVKAIDLEPLLRADEAAAELEAEESVRALVVTDVGPCFSAGLEPQDSPADQRRTGDGINRVVVRLYALPIPVVAAVIGHAIAGGPVVALACDHRIGAAGEVQLGRTVARAMAADLDAVPQVVYARIEDQLRAATLAANAAVLCDGDPIADAWLSADPAAAGAALPR